jgi:SulP family sulfate permease
MRWRKYFPLAEQLSNYDKNRFRNDLIAGLTVCILLVPQGMAYALLAGVPPIYGLYTGLVPLFIYGLMSSSRQVSLGPVAISSLLVLAGVGQLAEPGTEAFLELVILSALLIGVAQFLLGALRLGFLVHLLSNPVIMGFTSAAAIIIAVSQLQYLLGMDIPRFSSPFSTFHYAIFHAESIHWLSFAICTGAMFTMIVLKKYAPKAPGALLVTVVGIVAVVLLDLEETGLPLIGAIPAGLPDFSVPSLEWSKVKMLWPTVLTVTIMSVVDTISIGKALDIKNRTNTIRPNQELFALSFSKIIGSFFQAIPSSASFARSALNNDAGATSGVASLFTAAGIGLVLLFFTPVFYFLPQAILGAIVLVAVYGIFEVAGIVTLWKVDRKDFYMAIVTFTTTLVFGIAEGVLAGVVLSLLAILVQSSRPHIAILGQLPESDQFRNIKRFPEAIQFEGILIIRFDAPLFFLNAAYFKEQVQKRIQAYPSPLRTLLLDTSSIVNIDSSGLQAVRDLHNWCISRGIQICFCGTIGPVRDSFRRAGLRKLIGYKHLYLHPKEAVEGERKA